jgi:hypothetical protein
LFLLVAMTRDVHTYISIRFPCSILAFSDEFHLDQAIHSPPGITLFD